MQGASSHVSAGAVASGNSALAEKRRLTPKRGMQTSRTPAQTQTKSSQDDKYKTAQDGDSDDMNQPLTPFWPIFTQRSDGRDVVNNKGTPLRNGPSQSQLNSTPNEQGQSDYYRPIKKEDAKHIDWRKKLGGMLLREIGGKENEGKWQQCILWDLPEGYRLFEHIKSKINGESKSHSGGGHDRQDAYLYGHPKGPKKRFRSPVDFFPHLLWLVTDDTGDYNNCTCRMCSPMQIEAEKPAQPKPAVLALNTAAGTKTMNAPSGPVPVNRNPVPPVPIRRSSTGTPTAQSPAIKPETPTPTQNRAIIRAPPRLEPTPLPQPRSDAQQDDSRYNKFVARPGEVVWFQRPNGPFGLGLVVQRWRAGAGNASHSCYSIQPLSFPGHNPPQEIVQSENKVKPWLAWSVPNCTFDYLLQNPQIQYDQVNWAQLISGQFEGHAEVDASILAAKAVDTTYTPFEPLNSTVNNGIQERHYNGIYFGAEKIWRGEPVRLRIGMGNDILVVCEIIEKLDPASITLQNPTGSKIELRGDVYSYATLEAPNPKSPPTLPSDNHMPLRMREDMAWRNKTLLTSAGQLCYWKLMQANARVELKDVKGRWYEISILFQEFFFASVQKKEGGNGIWMNARGDATGRGTDPGVHRETRLAAFSNAIPSTLVLVEKAQLPSEPEKPATEMHGMELGMGAGPGENAFAYDDFVNFGQMEDPGMGFGDSNMY